MHARAACRTSFLAMIAGTALLSVVLTGCGPSAGEKALIAEAAAPLRGSEAVDRDAYEKLGYRLAWSGFAVFDRAAGAKLKGVYPLGDAVAVQDTRGSLTVLRASSGEARWSAALGNPLERYLGVERDGGNLLAVTESDVGVYEVDTGAFKSRQKFDRVASSGPARLADVLIMGTSSKIAFGHLMRSGQTGWAFTLSGPCNSDPILGAQDSVAYATDDGNVTVMDPGAGDLRGNARMFAGPGNVGDSGDGAYYIPSLDQSLYAFDVRTAAQRWRFRTDVPLINPVFFSEGVALTQVNGRGLLAVEGATGKQRWVAPGVAGNPVGIIDGRVLTFDEATGVATTVELKDGAVHAKVTLSGVAGLKATRKVGGELYAVSNRGEISKFTTR